MTRPRALLSLSLITLGAMLGGLGLGGYYEPRAPQGPPAAASISTSIPAAGPHLAPQGRTRFVAIANESAEKPAAAKQKPAAKAPAPAPLPKPKTETKEQRPEPKPKRPQQAAAPPWPWNLFSN
jgi:hypothetical protein